MKLGKRYRISIEGISPLIFNTRQREIELEMKKLKKDELDAWEDANWSRKAEKNSNGEISIPTRWVRKAFIDSCQGTQLVPYFATSKKNTYTKYAMTYLFENCTFSCKEKDLKPYGSYVGATGKRSSSKIWRIRPMIKNWKTDFEIVDPLSKINESDLSEILTYMGALVGIGDGRSLNFGRFELKSIKEIK